MTGFPRIVEDYLADLRRIRASGGATGETSSYTTLENLLNAVGAGTAALRRAMELLWEWAYAAIPPGPWRGTAQRGVTGRIGGRRRCIRSFCCRMDIFSVHYLRTTGKTSFCRQSARGCGQWADGNGQSLGKKR